MVMNQHRVTRIIANQKRSLRSDLLMTLALVAGLIFTAASVL
jgi:hypothetical protein